MGVITVNGIKLDNIYDCKFYGSPRRNKHYPYLSTLNKLIDGVCNEYLLTENAKFCIGQNLLLFHKHRAKENAEYRMWIELYEDFSYHVYIQQGEEKYNLYKNPSPYDRYFTGAADWMRKIENKRIGISQN